MSLPRLSSFGALAIGRLVIGRVVAERAEL